MKRPAAVAVKPKAKARSIRTQNKSASASNKIKPKVKGIGIKKRPSSDSAFSKRKQRAEVKKRPAQKSSARLSNQQGRPSKKVRKSTLEQILPESVEVEFAEIAQKRLKSAGSDVLLMSKSLQLTKGSDIQTLREASTPETMNLFQERYGKYVPTSLKLFREKRKSQIKLGTPRDGYMCGMSAEDYRFTEICVRLVPPEKQSALLGNGGHDDELVKRQEGLRVCTSAGNVVVAWSSVQAAPKLVGDLKSGVAEKLQTNVEHVRLVAYSRDLVDQEKLQDLIQGQKEVLDIVLVRDDTLQNVADKAGFHIIDDATRKVDQPGMAACANLEFLGESHPGYSFQNVDGVMKEVLQMGRPIQIEDSRNGRYLPPYEAFADIRHNSSNLTQATYKTTLGKGLSTEDAQFKDDCLDALGPMFIVEIEDLRQVIPPDIQQVVGAWICEQDFDVRVVRLERSKEQRPTKRHRTAERMLGPPLVFDLSDEDESDRELDEHERNDADSDEEEIAQSPHYSKFEFINVMLLFSMKTFEILQFCTFDLWWTHPLGRMDHVPGW